MLPQDMHLPRAETAIEFVFAAVETFPFHCANQIIALPLADVDAVPLVFIEREAGNGQRLLLGTGPFTHSLVLSPR
jgi:hypothetical protein